MNETSRIVGPLERLIDWSGKIVSFGGLIIMLLIVFEVFSRRIFNHPTIWSTELLTMIFGPYFILGIAYSLLGKTTVAVDLLYKRFSPRIQRILDLTTYIIFFFPFVSAVIYASFKFASSSWLEHEKSWSIWAPPVYHQKSAIFIGFILLAIQGFCEFIKYYQLKNKGD